MENENKPIKSPLSDELSGNVFAITEAALRIDTGILERKFALAYMQKQLDELPVPAEDASEEARQAYAKEKVKIDAVEVEIERQEAYREFIRETFHI